MGTAVLRSYDPLKHRVHFDVFGSRTPPPPTTAKASRRKQPRSSPSYSPPARIHPPPRKPGRSPPKPDGRRVSFADKAAAAAASPAVVKLPSRDLVMEEVKILKRGDEIGPSAASDRRPEHTAGDDDGFSPLFSTNRLGPEPQILPKHIGFENSKQVYAGPAYITSPAPSSLPFPAAFLKKASADAATKNLRSLLRIDGLP